MQWACCVAGALVHGGCGPHRSQFSCFSVVSVAFQRPAAMHLQHSAPPRPVAAARKATVASSSAQGGRAAPLRRQRRAAGRSAADFNLPLVHCPALRRLPAPLTQPNCAGAAPIRAGAGPCGRAAAAGELLLGAPCGPARTGAASLSSPSPPLPDACVSDRPGVKYDLVLSSGFLAFANHCGFLQAGASSSAPQALLRSRSMLLPKRCCPAAPDHVLPTQPTRLQWRMWACRSTASWAPLLAR